MDAALNHLRATGADVKKEDLARLSPLNNKHFNMLGRYHFTVPEEVLRVGLRPLRLPEEADEELQIAYLLLGAQDCGPVRRQSITYSTAAISAYF